jgi:hypothetical protein
MLPGTFVAENYVTFVGGNFRQKIKKQRLEVCGGIFRQEPIFCAVVSLTDLVVEISARNCIFSGSFFRQELSKTNKYNYHF